MHNMEKIYKENVEIVRKYLLCLTHNADISEELTQETFYKAIKSINSFKNNCKLSVWLCQIAKNLWYNELRKKQKIKLISDDEIMFIQSEEEIENNIILKEDKLELYRKLQKLDVEMRELVYLRITGELSFKEIANILGKTESWARTNFYRAKNKLKEANDYERN